MEIIVKPIGFIESPFNESEKVPIQSGFSDSFGTVVVDMKYIEGLEEIDGFSHIILIYYFDRAENVDLKVVPYLDTKPKGIFAIRHPNRPNKIGFSIVQLVSVEKNKLLVKGIDILNNTPLLDIKPFVPEFDIKGIKDTRIGWLSDRLRKEAGE
ncbi:MAG: tRNA (N6-threonylcarbamoyladenosine(37)-N6)-methyltransferase TrmO [Candidatus Heimdallarchaeota archaeon]|nr:tRNA (N6-threonylcarbamoyladenosine(37)-N6)-methyltransferase TrmO [Candidatus Heimdallarchaeota archaeon]MCK5143081.1 tRNA (N6-threonylcarbamoyladenosine(37)-N6)-methyltransferase TrmO [Candidatus Heimdallarchaeota archaeon]